MIENENIGMTSEPEPEKTPIPDEVPLENEAAVLPPDEEGACRSMRRQLSRVGWAVVATIAVWIVLMELIAVCATILSELGYSWAMTFYNRYVLIFNEATLALGILVGASILRRGPKAPPVKQSFSAGRFMIILFICFFVGYAGNILSQILVGGWNLLTNRGVENDVAGLIFETDFLMNFLMVGIAAPVLEELFFRKLIIDGTRQYGEKVCMILSALLFALFHQNFSQIFYAFGLGLLLAYLYCRSGKIWLPILLHAFFNIFSGVLSAEFLKKIMQLMEQFEGMTEEEIMAHLPEVMGSAAFLLLFVLYALVIFSFAITGLVLFIIKIRKFRFQPGTEMLSGKNRKRAIFSSAGLIAAVVVLAVFTVFSLFT